MFKSSCVYHSHLSSKNIDYKPILSLVFGYKEVAPLGLPMWGAPQPNSLFCFCILLNMICCFVLGVSRNLCTYVWKRKGVLIAVSDNGGYSLVL